MRIFRLHRSHRAASDYDGSLIVPGRWNPEGTPMLYCSAALSLACLETLVHLNAAPACYVYSVAELLIEPEIADFRSDLNNDDATRRFGHSWANSRRSLAILVPSAVIPVECNVLLNPTHSAFSEIMWSLPQRFEFDHRLLRRSAHA
jgi:RES domain-containing protein